MVQKLNWSSVFEPLFLMVAPARYFFEIFISLSVNGLCPSLEKSEGQGYCAVSYITSAIATKAIVTTKRQIRK
jgi:hypothetical protein